MTNPGKLRNRVSIQAPPTGTNNHGEDAGDYEPVADRFARIEPLAGSEGFNADRPTATQRYQITLRYFAGLTTRHRIVWGERVFNIDGLQTMPAELKVWHVLQVIERV